MVSSVSLYFMSDSQLDDAWYAAKMQKNVKDVAIYSAEIGDRIASVKEFIYGALGMDRFPKWSADKGFSTNQAQASIKASAKDTAGAIGSIGWTVLAPVIVLGLVAAVVVYQVKKR